MRCIPGPMDTSGRKGSDMNIFSLFTLCGGLAFFLYGMTVMSKSLEKMAGGKLERLLKRMTSNPIKVCCWVPASPSPFSPPPL